MPTIREFNVVEPPKSGEVEELVAGVLRTSRLARLVLAAEQEVPEPEAVTVEFRIAQTIHPQEGGMRIAGHTTEGDSIVVRTASDPELPATASTVVK